MLAGSQNPRSDKLGLELMLDGRGRHRGKTETLQIPGLCMGRCPNCTLLLPSSISQPPLHILFFLLFFLPFLHKSSELRDRAPVLNELLLTLFVCGGGLVGGCWFCCWFCCWWCRVVLWVVLWVLFGVCWNN